jgi:cysteinyl-tRNA synthetase
LQRHLEARGFVVRRVMNLTDVDDKTIRGSRNEHLPLREFTAPFKEAFFEDVKALQIKQAEAYPAATEERFVAAMIAMIETLISRGLAYQAEDKSVYYRINRFPKYGHLAHFDLSE